MIKTLLFSITFLVFSSSFAQSNNQPYWAILTNECAIAVHHGSGEEYERAFKEIDALKSQSVNWTNLGRLPNRLRDVTFGSKEAVLIIDSLEKNLFYALDPLGRLIYVKGNIIKAKYSINKATPGVGLLQQDFTLESGRKLKSGLFLWVHEIDSEEEKAVIQMGETDFIRIPLTKLSILRSKYSDRPSDWQFKEVVN